MYPTKRNIEQAIDCIPFVGMLCFVVLFGYAATRYPGGSQADVHSVGFDWVNNYWCNLMNEKGMNGQFNPARPISILAMAILCGSLMVFFIQFARAFSKNKFWKQTIITGGILSMSLATFMFTSYHDLITILSSVAGLLVVVGIIREVYQSKMQAFKITGIMCVCILGANNYIYYSQNFIEALPLLQKVTFVFVLLWISGLNYQILKVKASLEEE